MSGAPGSMPAPGGASGAPATGAPTGTEGATGTSGTTSAPGTGTGTGAPGTGAGAFDMSSLLGQLGGGGGMGGGMGGMDPQAMQNLMGMFNAGAGTGAGAGLGAGLGAGGSPAPTTGTSSTSGLSDEELKTKWSVQLQQMKDMGFTDENTNLDMLKQAQGNATIAIERLLGMLGP